MEANMRTKNPPMISERGELLVLQNGVLERKKDPTGARSLATEELPATRGSFLHSKTLFGAQAPPAQKSLAAQERTNHQ